MSTVSTDVTDVYVTREGFSYFDQKKKGVVKISCNDAIETPSEGKSVRTTSSTNIEKDCPKIFTNSEKYYMVVIDCLRWFPSGSICVHLDNIFIFAAIKEWYPRWKLERSKSARPNLDLLEQIDELYDKERITFEHSIGPR